MTWVDDFVASCHQALDTSVGEDTVRERYWSRGVDDDQIALFLLGYTDGNLPLDLPEAFLKWSFGGDRIKNSFVFPLTNALGEVKGLQFRSVEREKSGYMDYFLDETEPVFFGLGQASREIMRTSRVILVEGTFDLFPVQRAFKEVVATLTAKVSPGLIRLLKRLADRVYFSYDRDIAGKRGTKAFMESQASFFTEIVDIEYPVIKMIDGKVAKDPNEMWEAWGDERFTAFLRCTLPTPQLMELHTNAYDLF